MHGVKDNTKMMNTWLWKMGSFGFSWRIKLLTTYKSLKAFPEHEVSLIPLLAV